MIKDILEQLAPLDAQIAALKGSGSDMEAITAHASELAELAVEEDEILRSCGPLTAEDRVFLARHPERPHIDETISALFTDFFEQRGDRQCKEDAAILGGVARFHGMPVTVIGHRKGSTLDENLACNFGMPGPEGYRKALRLMKQAEKFGRPIITFIDTPGAYPGKDAEERGQGEAGVRPPRPGYLDALRRRCDEVGALLIFDEIQTGMGRTGRLFAMQKYGVTPDIVCLAKAFGGGMPLGAFVARHEVMDTLQENPALGHITTFGGHPVCCAAGLAALNYLVDNKVVERVETKGALYEMLLKDHPAMREIRRSGLLLAVELGESAKLYRIMELFREAGILSDWFLFCDTAFRISPPLTISEDEVRESAALIRSCLDRL